MGPADITDRLPKLLATVERPGDFYGVGAVPLPILRISIDGVGLLGLPVPAVQAEQLARLAEPAPYGRGADTLLDPAVRKCGQIAPSAVHLDDPAWKPLLQQIVQAAAAALGAEGDVTADLYKLLVYEPGGFFLEHRDTEKQGGMFATLLVVLPSPYEGGELVVRHRDQEAEIDFDGQTTGVAQWAAFYADCPHELRPVRSGYRLVLAYNLVRAGKRPMPVDYEREIEAVAQVLRAWAAQPDSPAKVVYPLAHHYTPAELSFAKLKNQDAAQAAVLVAAGERADCTVRLAMVSITESGSAGSVWDGRRRRRWYEDDDDTEEYEVYDIDERVQALESWRFPDDTPDPTGAIAFEMDEVAPGGALDDEQPDEDHFHEATGNEGGTFERTYRRAAVVMWPDARLEQVLAAGGHDASIPAIARLAGDPAQVPRAEKLARALIDDWPPPGSRQAWRVRPEHHSGMLDALASLPDAALLARFVRDAIAPGFRDEATDALVRALARLQTAEAGGLLRAIAEGSGAARFGAVATLLHHTATARPGRYLSATAEALVTTLPTQPADTWLHETPRSDQLAELLRALGATGRLDLVGRVAEHTAAHPTAWSRDDTVLPAVLAVHETGSPALREGLEPLRRACIEHLEARVALPLAPPPDAARATDGLSCRCADCAQLRAFLQDPRTTQWTLKANEAARRHVQHNIYAAKLDLDGRTIESGRPYSLVLTKNQASYERRVKQRTADLDALERLRA